MRLYLYCLSDELNADELNACAIQSVAGIAEAVPRMVDLGAIKAVVSDVQIQQVIVTKDNVLAHERVIDFVMAQTTPLPFRFGSVVTAAELQTYVASNEDRLLALLDRVRGAVEMSVKIIWDRDAVRSQRAETRSEGHLIGDHLIEGHLINAEGAGPGARFLLAKRQEIMGERDLKSRADEIASWLDEGLRGLVREKVIILNPADALVVSAAHLVERGRVAEYRERVNSLGRHRNDLRFLTSGAWPPYSFTRLRS